LFSNIFGSVGTKPYFDIHNRLQNLLNEKGNKVIMEKASGVIPMHSVSKPEVFVVIETPSGIVDLPRQSDIKDFKKFTIVVIQYDYEGGKNIILEIKPDAKWFR